MIFSGCRIATPGCVEDQQDALLPMTNELVGRAGRAPGPRLSVKTESPRGPGSRGPRWRTGDHLRDRPQPLQAPDRRMAGTQGRRNIDCIRMARPMSPLILSLPLM